MFDNQTPTAQSNQPASAPPKVGWHKLGDQNFLNKQPPVKIGNGPPSNLPIAQSRQNNNVKAPDDIFNEVDQSQNDNIERLTVNNFTVKAPAIKEPVVAFRAAQNSVLPIETQKSASLLTTLNTQPASQPAESADSDNIAVASRNFLNQQAPTELTIPQPPLSVEKQKSSLRKFFIFVLSAVILSLMIAGGILIYKIFKMDIILQPDIADSNPIIDDLTINEENNLINPPIDQPQLESTPIIVNPPPSAEQEPLPVIEEPAAVKPEAILDTDLDKIPDAEEIKIGTNPRAQDTDLDKLTDYEEVYTYKTDPLKKDSDNDQLTDAEEINTYKTDPLKNDTDGDGYSDGQEIKNGYNPAGEGRL